MSNTPNDRPDSLEREPKIGITFIELIDSLARHFGTTEEAAKEALMSRMTELKTEDTFSLFIDRNGSIIVRRDERKPPENKPKTKKDEAQSFIASSGQARKYNKETGTWSDPITIISISKMIEEYKYMTAGEQHEEIDESRNYFDGEER